jgi:hypothetical protein
MIARPDKTQIQSLRDAYKVSGFRVRARIDSYDELDHEQVTLIRIFEEFRGDDGGYDALRRCAKR